MVAGSVSVVKASSTTLAASLAPTGASPATLKELTQALCRLRHQPAKVEILKGRTVDGSPRVLLASLGEGQSKQSFWWFAPPNQPEGWFDEQGRRLGGTALAEPKPDSRISSPFGTRRYYGRSSGGGFHNGIDFEGKIGEPIYAAADGVINHQGWYFNYGRTVKISHADNFETLYAHMSRFADGMGPGSRVRKGDLIGYVGSTGRSTGPHLHFSVIVNGQFVDPAPYISEKGGNSVLVGEIAGRLSASGSRTCARPPAPTRAAADRGSAACRAAAQPSRGAATPSRRAASTASDRGPNRRSTARRCARPFDRLGIAPSPAERPLKVADGTSEATTKGRTEMFNKYMAAGVAAATLVGAAGTAHAGKDLDAVKARGQLICGVNTGVAGFALADSQGKWTGLDVDICRAVAAAIFGDAEKVKYVPPTAQQRFTALQSGEVDMLSRNTTWTLTRDTALGLDFTGVNYYDGQGFMVNKKLGVKSAKELNGATVCVQPGTTTELNLADYFRANKMTFKPVVIEKVEEVRAAFFAGRCDVYTTDASGLYSTRAANAPNPDDYIILPEIISKEPLGPVGAPRRQPVRRHRALGAVTPCSRPRSTASPRRTSTRC